MHIYIYTHTYTYISYTYTHLYMHGRQKERERKSESESVGERKRDVDLDGPPVLEVVHVRGVGPAHRAPLCHIQSTYIFLQQHTHINTYMQRERARARTHARTHGKPCYSRVTRFNHIDLGGIVLQYDFVVLCLNTDKGEVKTRKVKKCHFRHQR